MKIIVIALIILAFLQINVSYPGCLTSGFQNEAMDVDAEKAKIEAVLEKLEKALQTKNVELLSEVFSHDQDIIIIGPDSREMAFDWKTLAYMKNQQFRDLKNITISSKEQKITIDDSGDVARYFTLSDISFISGGLPFRVKDVRETGVLEKENSRWVIVQQHSSAPVSDPIWPFFFTKDPGKPGVYDADRKFSIDELREDYDLLRLALEEAHSGMHRYTPKKEFDALFNTLFGDIDREMTEIEFLRLISPIIEKIHCVHTAAQPSSDYRKVMNEKGLFFPFALKFISGKAYILQNFHPENHITPGSEVVAINDRTIPRLLSDFMKMLPSDGKNETYKYRILDWYFPDKYFLYIEQPESFELEYLPPEKKETATAIFPGVSRDKIDNTWFSYETLYKECLKLEILEESNLAVLIVRTFVPRILKHYGYNFYRFMQASFKEIAEKNISSLIIDLRWNDGGEVLYCKNLLAYLIDKPFQFASLETTSKPRYSFLEHTDKGLYFNYLHPNLWTRDNEGRYFLKGNWHKEIKPKTKAFKGKVYVLTNGMSISGSSDVAAILHHHKKAVFIGEETGGAYYGNNAGDFINLTLPNTHIRIRIPIRSSVLAVSGYRFKERGVVPDFEVKSMIEDILQGIDRELDFAVDLIKKSNRKD